MQKLSGFLLLVVAAAAPLAAQSPYFPLSKGAHWTLRSPGVSAPVELAVLDQQGAGYLINFSSPFGVNQWMLEPHGDRYLLTAYGANGQLAPLPPNTVYFDFGAKAKARWSNKIGKMEMRSRSESVSAAAGSFSDCITISQSGSMTFTFAPNVGPVRFTAGKSQFVLVSNPAVISATPARAGSSAGKNDDALPAQHVPTPGGGSHPVRTASSAPASPVPPRGPGGKSLFSITPNVFANEADTPENLLKNFDLVTSTGIGFLIHNGKWNELEPKTGKFDLSGLDFNVAAAKRLKIPICYTLRIIETVDRAVPPDMRKVSWSDPKMVSRLDNLIDAMAPHFQGTVRWFLIGNEIDGDFGRHQNELGNFVQLYSHLAQRLKAKVPGIRVASTLMFGGVDLMDGFMKPLADQFDFLCFTYYPIRSDFTMEDPSSVFQHVERMRTAAKGRKVVLQEIGYASGSANNSTPAKQAQFVQNVFQAVRQNSDVVEAGCFWLLADLKANVVNSLASYYGMANTGVFKSFLQTLGMFDGNGKPKPAWDVYKAEAKR